LAQQPPPVWVEHLGEIIAGAGTVWAILGGARAAVRRWLRCRERRASLDHAVGVLLDSELGALEDNDGDVLDITALVERRRTRIEQARDRYNVARGKQPGAPSGAPSPDREDETA
jgi:hypothetical protein